MVCVYTLKNPSFPEYKFRFKTGCQTVDIHEKEPYFLAVGLYNGFVGIINIKNEGKAFRLDSDLNKKHVGCVWEVSNKSDMNIIYSYHSILWNEYLRNIIILKSH